MLVGCADAGTTTTTRTPETTRAAATVEGTAASCVGLTTGQELTDAHLVFIGRFGPGATIRTGGRNVLVSPARFRVGRYIKGHGPRTLRVVTAVTANGGVSEDGLQAQPGERWLIYTSSKHGPYETSICSGSRLVASTRK